MDRGKTTGRTPRRVGAVLGCVGLLASAAGADEPAGPLRAGAAAVDITPEHFPVIVNGGFLSATAGRANDRLHARCLVLEDGRTRLALAVVDSCMLPRELLDEAKRQAAKATGIPPDRMLISATHTHSAPAGMSCLGTDADERYARTLPALIARAVELAVGRLEPARVGWAVVDAPGQTHCRRWILRPDRIGPDPFGGRTVRAMMHPGYQNRNYVGPAGPVDAGLSVLAVQSVTGRPMSLLANFSMHYYGASAVSADYYGAFCQAVARKLAPDDERFVAILSQGTSGDLHWMDYSRPRKPADLRAFADALAAKACQAATSARYEDRVPLAMAEAKLTLDRRRPDAERLAWARAIAAKMGSRPPRDRTEVYAREQLCLHEDPRRELILQAVRIGGLGIAAIPNEVFGITGLKLKARSPLQPTLNIELANGSEGYIPPPEQHPLGGYTTWPARTAALEVQAEPKIVDALLGLLEKVSGRQRRDVRGDDGTGGAYPKAVLASKPLAYWRMGEMEALRAADASGHAHDAAYEAGIAPYLEGPASAAFSGPAGRNRAAHFAGGRLRAELKPLGGTYTVEVWLSNLLPNDARAVTGYVFSRGPDGHRTADGDHLGIGGTAREAETGRLVFFNGDRLNEVLVGKTVIPPGTWHHVAMVRDGEAVRVYLDGRLEIDGKAAACEASRGPQLFLGGRNDGFANFEGRLDEAAVYDRALAPAEIAAHVASAGGKGAQ